MEKKDLIKLLDEIFIPLGFKRKGNSWVKNEDILTKLINLQKSNYGNFFYINYGFIIKGLVLTTTNHVGNRLAANNNVKQKRITDLLDFDTDIPKDQRLSELKRIINDKIVIKIQSINNEEDLLGELKERSHLNDIPLIVKSHFNLE